VIFEQLIHRDLGCAAYVVGCQASGEAVVVDPPLDVRELDDVLQRHRARLVAVLETHTHADHVSGHGTLALERGVPVHVHRLAGAEYPHEPLEDGSRIRVGNIELVARHAPGHRPEHTVFLIVDHTRADEPWLALTGDSLFVGDTARPDLAVAGDEGARVLYHTLHEGLLELPDGVEVFPGHVAGSLCGRGMSAKTSTTIGFERRFNPMLRVEGESAFVEEANRDLVPKPPNLQTVVALNRGPFLPRPPLPERLAGLPADAPLLDVRPSETYATGHAPGSLHAPANQTGFGNRVGWLLGADDAPALVATDEHEARHAARLLQAAGFLHQAGWVTPEQAGTAESFAVLELDELLTAARDGTLQVVDVREANETPAPLPGAHLVPLRLVAGDDLAGLDPALPTAVVCGSGARSGMGASLLARRGFSDLRPVLAGGMARLPAGVA
jgi:glyoxylase-like metal-dependent hydrolase (beta-lactamase superfamily II)/rhodanese-related sulfurtransferase